MFELQKYIIETKWKNFLEKQKIAKSIRKLMVNKMTDLLTFKTWSFECCEDLYKIIEMKDSLDIQRLSDALTEVLNYGLKFDRKVGEYSPRMIFEQKDSFKWRQDLNNLGIKSFKRPEEISLDGLIKLVADKNKNNPMLKDFAITRLKQLITLIKTTSYSKLQQLQHKGPISEWLSTDIQEWASIAKLQMVWKELNQDSDVGEENKEATETQLFTKAEEDIIIESFAVISRATQLQYKYSPRNSQLIAVLCKIFVGKFGLLLEIKTGEGKSLIVSMVAILKCLQGYKPDVSTSNEVLAKRDARETEEFYNMFNLTVAHNSCSPQNKQACYEKDIVYGAPHVYQGDILNEEFHGITTRANRPYNCAIIDEVDNMLIDDAMHITRLSADVSQFEHLKPVLYGWWSILQIFKQNLHYDEETWKWYYIEGRKTRKDGKTYIEEKEFFDDDKKKFEIPDLYQYIVKWVSRQLEESLVRGIDNPKVNFDLEGKVEEIENIQKVKIAVPSSLFEFAKNQWKKWVKSAYWAMFIYKQNDQYIIEKVNGKGKIRLVDSKNSGAVQGNTKLSDGLHQFLEIKEGLEVHPESPSSSIWSNVGYFRRYKQNIYGMTGTIGDTATQEFLTGVYNINIGFMPTFREKQCQEYKTIYCENDISWFNAIWKRAINEAEGSRAVLIIWDSIERVKETRSYLVNSNYPENKIYCCTKGEEHEIPSIVSWNQIVIATLIASRGTDISTTEEVEESGGLHVCVTFLPKNQRVQDQAFGRTSRKGNKGTCQMILKTKEVQHFLGEEIKNTSNVIHLRDEKEKAYQVQAKIKYINETQNKDELFKQFWEEYKKVCEGKEYHYKSSLKRKFALFLKSLEFMKEKENEKVNEIERNLEKYSCEIDTKFKANSSLQQVVLSQILKSEAFKGLTMNEGKHLTLFAIKKNHNLSKQNNRSEESKVEGEFELQTDVLGKCLFKHLYLEATASSESQELSKSAVMEAYNNSDTFLEYASKEFGVNIVLIGSGVEKSFKSTNNPNALIKLAITSNGKYQVIKSSEEADCKLEKMMLEKEVAKSFEREYIKWLDKDRAVIETREIFEIIQQEELKQAEKERKEQLEIFMIAYDQALSNLDEEVQNDPIYNTIEGKRLLDEDNYADSIIKSTVAFNLDPKYCHVAKANIGYAILEENSKHPLTVKVKIEVIEHLQGAINIINDDIVPCLNSHFQAYETFEKLSSDESNGTLTDSEKQVYGKIEVLKKIAEHHQTIIDIITETKTDGTEGIELRKIESLKNISSDKDHEQPIDEIMKEGGDKLRHYKKMKHSKSYWRRTLVGIFGAMQITAGLLIIYFSSGILFDFGVSLLCSGINDIYKVYKAISANQDIGLGSYFLRKTFDIGIYFTIGYLVQTTTFTSEFAAQFLLTPVARARAIETIRWGGRIASNVAMNLIGPKLDSEATNNTSLLKESQEVEKIKDTKIEDRARQTLLEALKESSANEDMHHENYKVDVCVEFPSHFYSYLFNKYPTVKFIQKTAQEKLSNIVGASKLMGTDLLKKFDKDVKEALSKAYEKNKKKLDQVYSSFWEYISKQEDIPNISIELVDKFMKEENLEKNMSKIIKNFSAKIETQINTASHSIPDFTQLITLKTGCLEGSEDVDNILNFLGEKDLTHPHPLSYCPKLQGEWLIDFEEELKDIDSEDDEYIVVAKKDEIIEMLSEITDSHANEDAKQMVDFWLQYIYEEIQLGIKHQLDATEYEEENFFMEENKRRGLETINKTKERLQRDSRLAAEDSLVDINVLLKENNRLKQESNKKLIQDSLNENEQGDLFYLHVISALLERSIKIFSKGTQYCNIGKEYSEGEPIVINKKESGWYSPTLQKKSSIFEIVSDQDERFSAIEIKNQAEQLVQKDRDRWARVHNLIYGKDIAIKA